MIDEAHDLWQSWFATKSPKALSDLADYYYPQLQRLVKGFAGRGRYDHDELLSQAGYLMQRSLRAYDPTPGSTYSGILISIVRNALYDIYSPKVTRIPRELMLPDSEAEFYTLKSSEPTPIEKLIDAEETWALWDQYRPAYLTKIESKVFNAWRQGNHIENETGLSTTSVDNALYRIRCKIKVMLRNEKKQEN